MATHPSKIFCMFAFTNSGTLHCGKKVMTITRWLLILSVHSLYLMIVLQLFLLGEVNQETTDMMSGGELFKSFYSVSYGSKTQYRSVTCLGAVWHKEQSSVCASIVQVWWLMGVLAPYLERDASIKAKNESCLMIHFVHRDKTHSNLLTLFIFS